MDGIESFHCPLCKCKTTVDFTAYLVEKAATIATLTTERDALATEIDRLEYCLRNSVGDACNLDTECRKAARSVLGDVVDGTEYGVPTLLDVVALVVALARNVTVERDALRDATRKVVEAATECLDDVHKDADDLRDALADPILATLRRD